jgi:antitoxin HigA-1
MARTPIHPGETLREDLQALGMSAAELARQINVPVNRVTEIMNGQRAITGDTALRLAHFFGTSAEFWLNLQKLYELRLAERKAGAKIARLPVLDRKKSRAPIPPPSSASRALARARN